MTSVRSFDMLCGENWDSMCYLMIK
ncbi:hypothetical protein KSS87_023534 [Heliosperma pusillum]|nr:hypothetical protein KSS87_023534 [Heliosperma pusillum]